jgi:type IV pilus assembly protein PilQ
MKSWGFLVCARAAIALAALAAATAGAGVPPPLPPLPPEMQGTEPPSARVVGTASAAHPFGSEGGISSWPDANGEATARRAAFERVDFLGGQSDDGPDDSIDDDERDRDVRDVTRSPTGAEAQPQTAGALSETPNTPSPDTLQGPPVPLAPAQRMGDSRSGAWDANETIRDNKPITLHFRQAELVDVLEAFARFTGVNIVASEKVRGAVSLHLDAVPWRTAFERCSTSMASRWRAATT